MNKRYENNYLNVKIVQYDKLLILLIIKLCFKVLCLCVSYILKNN